MAVDGIIADKAAGELPEEWKALGGTAAGSVYGEPFLQRKVDSVVERLFGSVIDADAQAELPAIVTDYAGKLVALQLINPGISYWSKQAVSVGATGRNEVKQWAANRSADLREVRKYLLEETRGMWIEVEPLIDVPGRDQPAIPAVTEPTTAYTPDPFSMEPAFDVTLLDTTGGT